MWCVIVVCMGNVHGCDIVFFFKACISSETHCSWRSRCHNSSTYMYPQRTRRRWNGTNYVTLCAHNGSFMTVNSNLFACLAACVRRAALKTWDQSNAPAYRQRRIHFECPEEVQTRWPRMIIRRCQNHSGAVSGTRALRYLSRRCGKLAEVLRIPFLGMVLRTQVWHLAAHGYKKP